MQAVIIPKLQVQYYVGQPISFVDPSGNMAGDVWTYQSDRSKESFFAWAGAAVADLSFGKYSHASMEINSSRQYTANMSNANAIVKNSDILHNMNGNKPRVIDIYRHKNIANFDANKATNYAKIMNKYGGKYFSDGWCSDRVVEGIKAGGLSVGDYGLFSTPNDLSRDSNFNHVGRYDTANQMSMEVQ